MEGSHRIVLICRGDADELAQTIGGRLRSEHELLWPPRSIPPRQKQRTRALSQAVEHASICLVVLNSSGPNTLPLKRAFDALPRGSGVHVCTVLFPGGPDPADTPPWWKEVSVFLDLRIDGDQLRAVENLLLALRDARPGKRLPRESEAAPTVPQPGLESQPTPDITDPTSESLHSRQAPFGSTDADDTSADPDDRPYKQDRPKALQEPLQWFAPLPNRRVEPLTPGQLNQRRADLKLAAAEQLLDEAVRLMDYRDARIKAAESKGTTLMGTVAIASSLVIAGAGLLLDSTHITGGWRDAVMILIASLLLFLIMCGYIASRGVLEVRRQSRPGTRAALRRAGLDDPREVMLDRAIDLFGRAGENRWVADYKLAQVRVAHGWYRLALVTFLLLGFTLTVYVVTR